MQVLVSVRTVAEAELVLDAGVQLLDLKDPRHGALAMLDDDRTAQIVAFARAYTASRPHAQTVCISATVGDVHPGHAALQRLMAYRIQLGVDVLKFPASIWAESDHGWLKHCDHHQVKCIAVMTPAEMQSADWQQQIQQCADKGYQGVMLDTQDKFTPLLKALSSAQVHAFVREAKRLQLMVGLAGGMQLDNIQTVQNTGATFIGFRGGLCQNAAREQALDRQRLATISAIFCQKHTNFCLNHKKKPITLRNK